MAPFWRRGLRRPARSEVSSSVGARAWYVAGSAVPVVIAENRADMAQLVVSGRGKS